MSQRSAQDIKNTLEQAEILVQEKRYEDAAALCRTLISQEPENTAALRLLARLSGFEESIPLLKKITELEPDNHEALFTLGRCLLTTAKPAQAFRPLLNAVIMDPDEKSYKAALLKCMVWVRFDAFHPRAKQAMGICLNDATLYHKNMSASWLSLISHDPKMKDLTGLLQHRDYEDFVNALKAKDISKTLNDSFLRAGLKRLLIHSPDFERVFTHLRRYYLMDADKVQRSDARHFLCALAICCWFNDYAFFETEEEKEKVEELQIEVEDAIINKVTDLQNFALIGCYRPFWKLENASFLSTLLHQAGDHDMEKLAWLQINEPLEEQGIKETLPSFSKITDETSKAVQQQYEENPYPRWAHKGVLELTDEHREKSKGLDILIAGCGTGTESISTYNAFPLASLTAIDLSRTSLAYAVRQTKALGIENITYKHGDILELKNLDQDFDMIVSTGVLHHMKKPEAGLQSFIDVLKPGGVIKIRLYSELARQDVVAVQDWAKEQDFDASAEGIRQFRKAIMDMPPGNPLRQKATTPSDFYTLSDCRDLLLHVSEHRFTCLDLKDMLEKLELELLVFNVPLPGLKMQYHQMFPDDRMGLNLENWHEFEKQNPHAFNQMYELYLGRKGELGPWELPDWLQGLWTIS